MTKIVDVKENFAPIKKLPNNIYLICWDYKEIDEKNASWVYERVIGKRTIAWIKNLILGYYNNEVDNKILNNFSWNGMPVWLSSENQFNYKAAYDLAVQTQGKSLPVTFKFGSTEEPVYYTFTNLEELSQFYMAAINFINTTLSDGWVKKDSIDWSVYEINE